MEIVKWIQSFCSYAGTESKTNILNVANIALLKILQSLSRKDLFNVRLTCRHLNKFIIDHCFLLYKVDIHEITFTPMLDFEMIIKPSKVIEKKILVHINEKEIVSNDKYFVKTLLINNVYGQRVSYDKKLARCLELKLPSYRRYGQRCINVKAFMEIFNYLMQGHYEFGTIRLDGCPSDFIRFFMKKLGKRKVNVHFLRIVNEDPIFSTLRLPYNLICELPNICQRIFVDEKYKVPEHSTMVRFIADWHLHKFNFLYYHFATDNAGLYISEPIIRVICNRFNCINFIVDEKKRIDIDLKRSDGEILCIVCDERGIFLTTVIHPPGRMSDTSMFTPRKVEYDFEMTDWD